jgi:hypothetical protein
MNSAMMDSLPNEIIRLIADLVDNRDLLRLRIVCKKLSNQFDRLIFRDLTVCIQKDSLER